ncbi:MAG: acetylornithine transaminase [Saccharofermentanales bacterium]
MNKSSNKTADAVLEAIVGQDEKYYLNVFGKRTPVCFTRGKGIYLYGTDNKKYMDLIGGLAVNVLGHSNSRLVGAISKQASAMIHCSNLFYIKEQAQLAEKLAALSKGLSKVFIANSGAEANEAAIKLARGYFYKKHTPRSKIITALNSFHGRTLTTVTATGQSKYHDPFRPLPPGFCYVPFNDIDALRDTVDDDTCAVMLELIQGESGIISATDEYIQAAVECCRRTGALLIIDEIQTGMGRTGTFFAYEQYGIVPDMVTLAKGLAGGVPIAALIASKDAASGFAPGDHGSTFGGNPLACAAALAVLDEYDEKRLVDAAKNMGDYFKNTLEAIREKTGLIKEIRGKGLMIGIKLSNPDAVNVKKACLEKGYLVNSIGNDVIRLLPPLIIKKSHINAFRRDFSEILKTI